MSGAKRWLVPLGVGHVAHAGLLLGRLSAEQRARGATEVPWLEDKEVQPKTWQFSGWGYGRRC